MALLLTTALMGISGVAAQNPPPAPSPSPTNPKTGDANPGLVAALRQSGAQITYHDDTGVARFITTAGRAIQQPTTLRAGASHEEGARGFLSVYGSLFGINDQTRELVRENEKTPDARRTFERFQQVYNNIPVIGGEIIVQTDSNNNILSANGETLPKIAVSTTPVISAAAATQTALNLVAKIHNLQASDLTTTTPALWIYNPILISPDNGPTALVWRMDVTTKNLSDIRELVLVETQRGSVVLHFNQTDDAVSLQTYTANGGSNLPGQLVCTQTNPTCSNGDADAKGAHTLAKTTYDFYMSQFGRNSIDNAGMTIKSTVHYRDPDDPSEPLENAFWNGDQMVYGDADTFSRADDVVAHELTHGVTQYESGLFYYYQSGAINESFSDVFGEFVDQTDGTGNDSASVKWDIGEDALPLGTLRSMSDPTRFGDPDKMTSTNYYYYPYQSGFNSRYFDNGGVHSNSGINNKAAYLMTDGATFNGYTVTGLGINKVAKIYYEVQTNLLTSGADYADLYNDLYQACFNVVGSVGITVADCQQVRNATNAVEMNLQPNVDPNPSNTEAPVCPAGQVPSTIIFGDDLENGRGNWDNGAVFGSNHWFYDSPYGTYAHSGIHELYADDTPATTTSSYVAMSAPVVIPDHAYLRFAHAYGFQPGEHDGGIVQFKTDNNSTWTQLGVAGTPPFTDNGYNGTLLSSGSNPLRGDQAFVDDSHGYITSRVDLSSLVGQSVTFRWNMGLDSGGYNWGWWLDDVMIYSCGAPIGNDNFASSKSITLPYSHMESTAASSLELVEKKPTCENDYNVENSVWFSYTPTADQKVGFTAVQNTGHEGLSVWTGSDITTLTQVTCSTPNTNTTATFNVTNGTTYYIRVGSAGGMDGTFTLQAAVSPINDDFANAIPVEIDANFTPFTDTQDVMGAGVQTGEPNITNISCDRPLFHTVWYKYVSLGNNTLNVTTAGTDYDTRVSVWKGTSLSALTFVDCKYNQPTTLTLNATSGTTYYFRVSSGGNLTSHLTFGATAASVDNAPALANYYTTATPTLTWGRVSDATQYEVQVSTSATFTPLPLVFTKTVTADQVSIDTDPLPEGIYYWRVRAIRNGVAGAFSAVDTFAIDLP